MAWGAVSSVGLVVAAALIVYGFISTPNAVVWGDVEVENLSRPPLLTHLNPDAVAEFAKHATTHANLDLEMEGGDKGLHAVVRGTIDHGSLIIRSHGIDVDMIRSETPTHYLEAVRDHPNFLWGLWVVTQRRNESSPWHHYLRTYPVEAESTHTIAIMSIDETSNVFPSLVDLLDVIYGKSMRLNIYTSALAVASKIVSSLPRADAASSTLPDEWARAYLLWNARQFNARIVYPVLDFLNHDCEANLPRSGSVFAVRDYHPGEEVYNNYFGTCLSYPCRGPFTEYGFLDSGCYVYSLPEIRSLVSGNAHPKPEAFSWCLSDLRLVVAVHSIQVHVVSEKGRVNMSVEEYLACVASFAHVRGPLNMMISKSMMREAANVVLEAIASKEKELDDALESFSNGIAELKHKCIEVYRHEQTCNIAWQLISEGREALNVLRGLMEQHVR